MRINTWCIRIVFVLFVLYGLTGCGAHSERKTDLKQRDLKNHGVITGSITKQRIVGIMGKFDSYAGHEIVFTNLKTGKAYPYPGADYFQLHLPEGRYALSAIRLASGSLVPKTDPFTFSVSADKVKYIGSVVSKRDIGDEKVFSKKTYVLKKKREDSIQGRKRTVQLVVPKEVTLFVVDAGTSVEMVFKNRNPELSNAPIITEPLR